MNDWLEDMVSTSPAARHVAWAGELSFAGARDDDRAGRTVRFNIVVAPEDVGKANPFSGYTRRRAGHAGTRFQASFAAIDGAFEWMDEVMLLGWSDGPKGSSVTFMLSPTEGRHPFFQFERGTACFMVTLIEISDDETPVDQVKRARVEGGGQKVSNAAAQVIKNPVYWDWMQVGGTTDADIELKRHLDIKSKAELDRDPEAVKRFRAHMDEFVSWQKAEGLL
jgi:hypothetical protein